MGKILRSGHGMAARSARFKKISGASARAIVVASREITPNSSEIKTVTLPNGETVRFITVNQELRDPG